MQRQPSKLFSCPSCEQIFNLGENLPKMLPCSEAHAACHDCLKFMLSRPGLLWKACPICGDQITLHKDIPLPSHGFIISIIKEYNIEKNGDSWILSPYNSPVSVNMTQVQPNSGGIRNGLNNLMIIRDDISNVSHSTNQNQYPIPTQSHFNFTDYESPHSEVLRDNSLSTGQLPQEKYSRFLSTTYDVQRNNSNTEKNQFSNGPSPIQVAIQNPFVALAEENKEDLSDDENQWNQQLPPGLTNNKPKSNPIMSAFDLNKSKTDLQTCLGEATTYLDISVVDKFGLHLQLPKQIPSLNESKLEKIAKNGRFTKQLKLPIFNVDLRFISLTNTGLRCLQDMLSTMPNISKLNLGFIKSENMKSADLCNFVETCSRSLLRLTDLGLNLGWWVYLDKDALNNLIGKLAEIQNLERLSLDFSGCLGLRNQVIGDALIGMKDFYNLQSLELIFKNCKNVTDKCVRFIINNCVDLPSLERLKLDFTGCVKFNTDDARQEVNHWKDSRLKIELVEV